MLSRFHHTFTNFSSQFHHIKRPFSVTKLSATDDKFLLLQHAQKNIYLVGNNHIPNTTANKINEVITAIKPDTVFLQICQHRAEVIHKLSSEYGDKLDDDMCYTAALEDFANKYPMSSGIFSKSKTIIKPFELFGLLFSYADYKAIHAGLLNQSELIFGDNKMKNCIDKFEESINKIYDPRACLSGDNMFEKDMSRAEMERELAMGKNPKEIRKNLMKKMLERMQKNRPNVADKDVEDQQKKLYLNQQLEIDLDGKMEEGQKEIDWESIYSRENARILINEVRESMKVCVDVLIDERNKNICDMLLNCNGSNVVAFVNFANMDGIEDKWLTL
eukprot:176852_1